MATEILSTTAALKAFLDSLGDCTGLTPRLYIDLEGGKLCRHGTLSLMTILVEPQSEAYLVDVTTLQHAAFSTAGSDGRTLKAILESSDIFKVFFDIRNDSDALFALYGIRVAGIVDLQLMELATRSYSKERVKGLAKCIENDAGLGYSKQHQWQEVKDKGKKLFAPELGGSYTVFDARPLSQDMIDYCTQDVRLMPHLRRVYHSRLCDAWWSKVQQETNARIVSSQSPAYVSNGPHKVLGPRHWISFTPTPAERTSRLTLVDQACATA